VSEIQLYLDEDVEAHALIRALRSRGVNVATTSEANLMEATDEAQLEWASREGRVLMTYNAADFCRLHARFSEETRTHAGLLVAEQQRHSVGETMRGVLKLRATLDAQAMRGRLEFLNRWI